MLNFDGNVEDVFCRDFTFDYDYFGEKKIHELKPGGSDIPLTNENRNGIIFIHFSIDLFSI